MSLFDPKTQDRQIVYTGTTTPQDKDTTLDDLLSKVVYKEGDGPNGSGGEFYYVYTDTTKNSNYSQAAHKPLKDVLIQWRDKQVEAVLDRLEATFNDAHIDKVIEAERNKLKETPNED